MRAPRPLSPAAALLPLRVFLGATFAYAGVQKLSDPGFLTPGASTLQFGTQLHGFAQGTPGGFLLRTFALPHPGLAGVGVALVEIAVGVLMLLGLATRAAALVGLGLNLVLFLTASSAHLAVLPRPGHRLRLRVAPVRARGQRRAAGTRALGRPRAQLPRAQFLRRGVGRRGGRGRAGRRRGCRPARRGADAGRRPGPGADADAGVAPGSGATGTPRRRRAAACAWPPRARLPRDSGALYPDPADGQADIVVRHADGSLSRACSAICTHAGCRVEYQAGALPRPCHGSIFDSRTGAVRQGPATQPLPRQAGRRAGREHLRDPLVTPPTLPEVHRLLIAEDDAGSPSR